MNTRYAIRHKETKQFFLYRVDGVSHYSSLPQRAFKSATEATVKIIQLGASEILEVVSV